jgi:hypothetical protein
MIRPRPILPPAMETMIHSAASSTKNVMCDGM